MCTGWSGGAAHHQFAARSSAGGRSDPGRRNCRSGAQGIRASSAKEKLSLGANDRLWDTDPTIRLFSYTPGRGGRHAQPLYDGIKPGVVLMSDGYEVYNAIAAVHGAIHLGCWAHTLWGTSTLWRKISSWLSPQYKILPD